MDFKKIIKVIPLIMGLLIIPVSMRMIKIDIPFEVQLHWKGVSTEYDIFGYYRSILLIINAVITSVILFFSFTSDTFIWVKKLKPVFIAFGILVFYLHFLEEIPLFRMEERLQDMRDSTAL